MKTAAFKIDLDLTKYLGRKKILKQFIRNVDDQPYFAPNYVKETIRNIDDAFLWKESPEGHDFWEDYHEEYEKLSYSKSK